MSATPLLSTANIQYIKLKYKKYTLRTVCHVMKSFKARGLQFWRAKFQPLPPHQCSVQSHSPTDLNAHLVGLSREKEMLEQNTAIQLNLARSRQEVKRQNNKLHLVTFQNKTLCVDTSTHREASCLLYCPLANSNRNWWGLPERRSKTVSEPQHSGPLSSGNWADSLAILMDKNNTQRS